jgi:group I intron endonuclease
MKGVIYCYHCIPTGKKYIGQTKYEIRRKEYHRYISSKGCKRKFYNAVRKYGWENFIYGIIEECEIELLTQKEISYIKEFNTFEYGYNSTLGGDGKLGWKHSEKTKEKIRKSNLGKKRSPEQRQLLSDIHKNKPLSEENKKNISKALKEIGHLPPSHKNTKWWNNRQTNKRSVECPGEGWIFGRLPLGPYLNRRNVRRT